MFSRADNIDRSVSRRGEFVGASPVHAACIGDDTTEERPVTMTALTAPALIEEIIQRYDAKVEPFTEFNVGGELNEARRALIDATELENLGAWSEVCWPSV